MRLTEDLTIMNGADILLESLKKEGVDLVFGYPGGQILGTYDRLFDCSITHILPRHEQGGIHAAWQVRCQIHPDVLYV